MQGRLRIAIVGYGTAGQAAAIMLHAQGHALSVFEQAPVLNPVGAGFLLQPTGFGVLVRLGLHETALEHGQRIERLHGCNHRGRMVMDMRYADHAPDCFGVGMTRGSLFTVLRDDIPRHMRSPSVSVSSSSPMMAVACWTTRVNVTVHSTWS
jgi:2-polyprenyl-6-methoxyphenol hydroxylase-like FAD-dependent oxidoreductase